MAGIDVLGYVVASEDEMLYRWFGYDCISPRSMYRALVAAGGEDVVLRINSYGGLTWAASEIYTMLMDYRGKTTADIVGLAASAAGVIAIGCKHVRMSPTAEFMMHNPWSSAEGDYRDMEHTAQSLRECRETIINAFALRCKGLSRAEIGNMLNRETWMSAQKAVAAGVADEMMFVDGPKKAQAEGQPAPEGGGGGARAAAMRMPSAQALKAQKAAWEAIAPGAESLEEAKAALNALRAAAGMLAGMNAAGDPPAEGQGGAPEDRPGKTDDEEYRNMLRAQIGVLGEI